MFKGLKGNYTSSRFPSRGELRTTLPLTLYIVALAVFNSWHRYMCSPCVTSVTAPKLSVVNKYAVSSLLIGENPAGQSAKVVSINFNMISNKITVLFPSHST